MAWVYGTAALFIDNIVDQPTVPKFEADVDYPDELDAGPYPIPDNPSIEYGSDHHIVVDTETCVLYEIFDASFDGTNWNGGGGAIWDLNSNALRLMNSGTSA